MSSPMVPSIRVCHTSTITVKQAEFSTWLETPSVLLSTRVSTEESSQRESTLESSTPESQDQDSLSSRELRPTINSRLKPRKLERKSSPRESQSNHKTPRLSPELMSPT